MKKILLFSSLFLLGSSMLCNCGQTKTYTVSFQTNGGGEIADVKVKDGDCVSKPTNPIKPHYAFTSWYLDNDTFQKEYDFGTSVHSDFTLYAKYEQIEYKVSFHCFDGKEPTEKYVPKESTMSEPTIPKRGEDIFDGWYYCGAPGMMQPFDFEKTKIVADIDLYAKWRGECFVIYDSNGGSLVKAQSIKVNQIVPEPVNPTKDSYVFDGWYLDQSTFKNQYLFDAPIDRDLFLYAKWKQELCTVIFESNGGTPVPSQTVPKGQLIVKPTNPTKIDGVFVDWYDNATFQGNPFNFKSPITTPTLTLYAKWKGIFTITFESNGGEPVSSQSVVEGECATKPVNPIKPGGNFTGWYLDNDTFKNKYDFSTPITTDITLYAYWTVPIILDAGEGALIEKNNQQTYTIAAPQNKTWGDVEERCYGAIKEGYEFKYWVLEGTEERFLETNVINKAIKLIAVYDNISSYLAITPRCENCVFTINPIGEKGSIDVEIKCTNDDNWIKVSEKTDIPLPMGEHLFIKGKNDGYYGIYVGVRESPLFSSKGAFAASGLAESIVTNSDKPIEEGKQYQQLYALFELFDKCSGIISAYNLRLPDKNVGSDGYFAMFCSCSNLLVAPKELPAEKLAFGAYSIMFKGCTNLVRFPNDIPATDISTRSFEGMFEDCLRIVTPPMLHAREMIDTCFAGMFKGCISLTTPCVLPETEGVDAFVCQHMFANCVSLERAPKSLPAHIVSKKSYYQMFLGCKSLKIPPIMTNLVTVIMESLDGIYEDMFRGCTSLNIVETGQEKDAKCFFICSDYIKGEPCRNMFAETKNYPRLYTPSKGNKPYFYIS